jgi:hypothetical protein
MYFSYDNIFEVSKVISFNCFLNCSCLVGDIAGEWIWVWTVLSIDFYGISNFKFLYFFLCNEFYIMIFSLS